MGQQGDSGRTFKSGISESALNTAYFVQRPGNLGNYAARQIWTPKFGLTCNWGHKICNFLGSNPHHAYGPTQKKHYSLNCLRTSLQIVTQRKIVLPFDSAFDYDQTFRITIYRNNYVSWPNWGWWNFVTPLFESTKNPLQMKFLLACSFVTPEPVDRVN